MHKTLPLLAALALNACALSHDLSSTSDELSVAAYRTVELDARLTDEQKLEAHDALKAWNDATGEAVFAWRETSDDVQHAAIRISAEPADDPAAYIVVAVPEGMLIPYGDHEPGQPAPLMHLLGTAIGVPDDMLPGSVMNLGPSPNCCILPAHVEIVRELLDGP